MHHQKCLIAFFALLTVSWFGPSSQAFDPAECTDCIPSTVFGTGPHQVVTQASGNVVKSIKGIPDVPNSQVQRIVFDFIPGPNLANQTSSQGHMAVLGRGQMTINGTLYHYVGTGIAIGQFDACHGIAIENFHLADGTNGWSKLIKCKPVVFSNALHRITLDITRFDVLWTLEKLTFQNVGGEPIETWVQVASDGCRGGTPLSGTNFSMCSEIRLATGETTNYRHFSEVGIADVGLRGWIVDNLMISQY